MRRLSKRPLSADEQAPQLRYVYVEKPVIETQEVEVPVEVVVHKEIEVPGETIILQQEVDLDAVKNWCSDRINEQNVAHAMKLQELHEYNLHIFNLIKTELEMQRRALVALKTQRDIDRRRRLSFIQRVKKERDQARKENFKLKLAAGASIVLSLLTFIVK